MTCGRKGQLGKATRHGAILDHASEAPQNASNFVYRLFLPRRFAMAVLWNKSVLAGRFGEFATLRPTTRQRTAPPSVTEDLDLYVFLACLVWLEVGKMAVASFEQFEGTWQGLWQSLERGDVRAGSRAGSNMLVSLVLAASTIFHLTTAQAPICTDPLQCDYCGHQGDSPQVCIAFNSTVSCPSPDAHLLLLTSVQFDDLPGNAPFSLYETVTYTGFDTWRPNYNLLANHNTVINIPHIQPHSKPAYAVAQSGYGVISMQGSDYNTQGQLGVGTLRNFYFGCATPSGTILDGYPMPCTLTVYADCIDTITTPSASNSTQQIVPYAYSAQFTYTPDLSTGELVYTDFDPITIAEEKKAVGYPQLCFNYTLDAVGMDGKQGGVALVIDDVVFTGLYEGA
ncbi:hypothetical protein MRB53_037591 [Persea americana]|nr:hypothetical protein MRB53_037591 [Persea americana]